MRRDGFRLAVLTYHRVAEPSDHPDLNPRMISASPRMFERQMRLLRNRHRVVSLPEVLAALDGRSPLPPRAVHVTFDDAYADLPRSALRVLRELSLPATIFVPTSFPDHPERSYRGDRLYRAFSLSGQDAVDSPVGRLPLSTPGERRASLRRLQYGALNRMPHEDAEALVDRLCRELGVAPSRDKTVMGWSELRELAREGFAIAPHSRTHRILTGLGAEELHREVAGSREDLRRELGAIQLAFCYPNGAHDETVVSMLRDEGYRVAFTTRFGANDLRVDDPLRLRRSNITPRTSLLLFGIRLTHWGARLDAFRHRNDPTWVRSETP